jgi:hypothetical protein
MPWDIVAGPEHVNPPPPGGRSWLWRLADKDGRGERTVEVIVSDIANDTTHARMASSSRGRTVVDDVLDWTEPPQRIRCTIVGFVCEG